MPETKTLYNNGFIQVRAREIDGRELITIDRVKTQTGAIVVPITPEGKIILVKEYREGARQSIIGVVKGAKDDDSETYEDVAQRELMEELGVEAEEIIDTGIDLYALPSLTATQGRVMFAYGCRQTSAPDQESDESVEVYEEVDMATLIVMLRGGQVNDAESCAALQSLVLHNL